MEEVGNAIKDLSKLMKKSNITVGYMILTIIFLILVNLSSISCLITDLISTIYPTYMSIKDIETKGSDHKLLLIYWIVFAFFKAVIDEIGKVLFWNPLYYFAKLGFLIYLIAPQTRGAIWLYDEVIMSLLDQFIVKKKRKAENSRIKKALKKIVETINKFLQAVKKGLKID